MGELLGHRDIVRLVESMNVVTSIPVNFNHFEYNVDRFFSLKGTIVQVYKSSGDNTFSRMRCKFNNCKPDYYLSKEVEIDKVKRFKTANGINYFKRIIIGNEVIEWRKEENYRIMEYGFLDERAFYIADFYKYGTWKFPFERVFIKSKD